MSRVTGRPPAAKRAEPGAGELEAVADLVAALADWAALRALSRLGEVDGQEAQEEDADAETDVTV